MKKRLFTLALVVGVLLSVCASAWADTKYKIEYTRSEYRTVVVNTDRDGKKFYIRVGAKILSDDDSSYKDATKIVFTATQSPEGTVDSLDLSSSKETTSGSATYTQTLASAWGTSTDSSKKVWAYLTGYIKSGQSGTINVAIALSGDSGPAVDTGDTLNITFSTTAKGDEKTSNASDLFDNTDSTTVISGDADIEADTSDPSDPENWDGLDPKFYPGYDSSVSTSTNTVSEIVAIPEGTKGAKPALGKIADKTKLNFKPGSKGTLPVPITGSAPIIDVVITAKDAKKLWPASKDEFTDDIRLSRTNIEKYKIPFRVTGAKVTTVTDKTKTPSSTITLAFNGANVEYKSYPITFKMENGLTKKEVSKALKLNVGPTNSKGKVEYSLPIIYRDSEDVTNVTYSMVSGDTVGWGETSADIDGNDDYEAGYRNLKFVSITSGDIVKGSNGEWKVASKDGVTSETIAVTYKATYDKPEKYSTKNPKSNWQIVVGLTSDAASIDIEEADSRTGSLTYFLSTDTPAPYTITVKGVKAPLSYDLTNPVFDAKGNVEDPGSVTIKGNISTAKDSKTAITITATNTSTKKKTAAKVTVLGQAPAKFDKTKNWAIPEDEADEYDDEDEEGYNLHLRMPFKKYGEPGKLPSISFKAKGAKPITYTVADEYNDDDILNKLKNANLSVDVKSGKLVAWDGNKKNVKPTVDDDGNFESFDLYVHAQNNVEFEGESSYARALVGVTGAKPSLKTNTVTFGTGDMVSGDYVNYSEDDPTNAKTFKTFTFKAGKLNPAAPKDTAANVKATLADAEDTTLSDLGLELVTYEDMYRVDSNDTVVGYGDTIFTSGDADSADFRIVSVDGTTELSSAVSLAWTYIDDNGNRLLSEDLEDVLSADAPDGLKVKWGTDTFKGNPAYKNMGIVRVKDFKLMEATKGATVNINLENLGLNATGKLKVIISATTSSSNTASARSTVTVDAKAGKTGATKNGKGGGASTGAPEDYELEAEDESEVETEEPLTIGAERTAADLTSAQQAYLAANGYKVIAVLPELTANVDGQQDIDDVELDEDAPEGEKMIYIPFPKDVPEVEDDSIVDFYDEAGAPVEGVPASHKIIASPWLREGVTYEPVIAIEAE